MLITGRKVCEPRFATLLHSGNNPANFCWPVRFLEVKVLPGIGSVVDCSAPGARFTSALGLYQQAVEQLARSCSDGAAACPFVRTHSSRKRKPLRHRQNDGVRGVLVPAKSSATSR
jgi:hypothetical protein